MRVFHEPLLWACVIFATVAAHNVTKRESSGGSKRVVCYYTNWSVYRPGTAKFNPQNINPYLCTHLIYAFGGLTRENGLRPYDKYQDIEQGGYAKFTGLKTYNKQLKTMLAIGGWNEGSTRFSPLVASVTRRAEFVKNVVRFLRQNHFDGLDLDWEYPAFRDGGKPRDRDNYAQLVQELREEFDRESSKTGRPRLLLTMAVPAGIEYIDKGYDIPKLNRYLDFMNILSYDYHSSFEPSVNHHSPLYPLEEEGEYNFDAQLSIDYTINHYLKLGADQDKLVLGIPTYGRSYTLFNPDSTELGSPADGPGEQGDATREKGYLAYYEICENLAADDEWQVVQPNPRAMGPYAFKGNQWVGYDDEDIVKKKARYVTEKGLGGIMYWAIDNDDFRGKCHGRPYPLIEAGKEAMLAGSGTSNELDSTLSRSKARPKPRVTTEEAPISNSGGGSSRPSSGGKRRRPTIKNKASTSTSTTPGYSYPTSTPEPPTTPDPGSDFKCEDEGFFPHPRDCKKYFWCLDSGPSNLGIVAHQFTCPSGLFFNKAADSCDYTRNVVCNTKAVEPTTTTAKPSTTSRSVRIVTTTSTTTAAPEEEEEYEEYDEEPEEDPKAIKELIDLIKKLGGIANLEKQLHLDGSSDKKESAVTQPAISKKLYNRVLSQASVRGNSNANFYNPSSKSSTPHTLIFKNRGRQNEGLENLSEVRQVSRQEKPQYVTIRRERPTTPTTREEDPEDNEDVDEEVDEVDEVKKEDSKTAGRSYVTIRRDRPAKTVEEDVTTPKYVSIRRPRPSQAPEVEEESDDIPDEVPALEVEVATSEATTTTTTTTSSTTKPETLVSRKKLSPFAPRTVKTGSVLESFRRKKKEEEVTVTTEEVNEEIATVTTETTRAKVSDAPRKTTPALTESAGAKLEGTRGRGYKLSSTPNPLQDDLPNVNIYSAYSPEPEVEKKGRRFFRPSTSSEPSVQEELVSVPEETVPPVDALESLPLSTALPEEETIVPSEETVTPSSTLEPSSSEASSPSTEAASSTTEEASTAPSETEAPVTLVDALPSSSSVPEETVTTPNETVPPLTTLESLPLSTTTQFTPTVTRVVTSESESATERHRISLKKYKGFYLKTSSGTTTPRSTDPNSKTEKVMEVNRVTHVTFKDDFSVPFTRPISGDGFGTQSPLSSNSESNDLVDQNGVSQARTDNSENVSSVTQATVSSTTGGKKFRPPYRATSTRNPLPNIKRRRLTTPTPLLPVTVGISEEQPSTRRAFVPTRRGSYRPKTTEELVTSGIAVPNDGGNTVKVRRPFRPANDLNASTEKPSRFTPQKSRERKKLITEGEDDAEREDPESEEAEEEVPEEVNEEEESDIPQKPSVSIRPLRPRLQRPLSSRRGSSPREDENQEDQDIDSEIAQRPSVSIRPLRPRLQRPLTPQRESTNPVLARKPPTILGSRRTTTVQPERSSPQYKSRGSTTFATDSVDENIQDAPSSEEPQVVLEQELTENNETASGSPEQDVPTNGTSDVESTTESLDESTPQYKSRGNATFVTNTTDGEGPSSEDPQSADEQEETKIKNAGTSSENPRQFSPSRRTSAFERTTEVLERSSPQYKSRGNATFVTNTSDGEGLSSEDPQNANEQEETENKNVGTSSEKPRQFSPSRRTSAFERTTEKPERSSPQYRSRGRTTFVTENTDEDIQNGPTSDVNGNEGSSENPRRFSPSRRPVGRTVPVQENATSSPVNTNEVFTSRYASNNDRSRDTEETVRSNPETRNRGRTTYVTQSSVDTQDQELPDDILRVNAQRGIDYQETSSARPRNVRPTRKPVVRRITALRNSSSQRDDGLNRISTTTAEESSTPRPRVNHQYINRGRKTFLESLNEVRVGGESQEVSNESSLTDEGGRIVKKIRKRPLSVSSTTPEPIRSRGRVVKKIKKRPLGSTTSDPATGQTSAPIATSSLAALDYDINKIGVEGATFPADFPTETNPYGTSQYPLDGYSVFNTASDEDIASTPTPNEDYLTTVNFDDNGEQIFNDYDYRPRHEVFETQYSSNSYETPKARGTHKFELEDVVKDDSLDAKVVAKLTPRNRRPQLVTRLRPQTANDFVGVDDEKRNSLGESSEGNGFNRDRGTKRRLVVKKTQLQPTSTTEGEDVEDADTRSEVSTTTPRSLRRPGGSLFANNRLRSRSTTAPTTTTSTTEATSRAASVRPGRRQLQVTAASRNTLNRRRKYGDTTTSPSEAVLTTEATATEPTVTNPAVEEDDVIPAEPKRKFSFLRRRTKVNNGTSTNTTDSNTNTNTADKVEKAEDKATVPAFKNKRISLTVKTALRHVVDSQNEPSTIKGIQSQEPIDAVDDIPTVLPDLANVAVVAIHNLATTPTRSSYRRKEAATSPAPAPVVEHTREYSRGSLRAVTSAPPPRVSSVATPFAPRRGTAVYVTSTAAPPPQRDYDSFKPRPYTKITSPQLDAQSGSLEDYEYYDHGEGIFANPSIGKVKIHSDGYIECLDQGNFPHPFSCKKFISCAKMDSTDVLGWEYTCPRHLSFDPIGGICNWSAGLGCKE